MTIVFITMLMVGLCMVIGIAAWAGRLLDRPAPTLMIVLMAITAVLVVVGGFGWIVWPYR